MQITNLLSHVLHRESRLTGAIDLIIASIVRALTVHPTYVQIDTGTAHAKYLYLPKSLSSLSCTEAIYIL